MGQSKMFTVCGSIMLAMAASLVKGKMGHGSDEVSSEMTMEACQVQSPCAVYPIGTHVLLDHGAHGTRNLPRKTTSLF